MEGIDFARPQVLTPEQIQEALDLTLQQMKLAPPDLEEEEIEDVPTNPEDLVDYLIEKAKRQLHLQVELHQGEKVDPSRTGRAANIFEHALSFTGRTRIGNSVTSRPFVLRNPKLPTSTLQMAELSPEFCSGYHIVLATSQALKNLPNEDNVGVMMSPNGRWVCIGLGDSVTIVDKKTKEPTGEVNEASTFLVAQGIRGLIERVESEPYLDRDVLRRVRRDLSDSLVSQMEAYEGSFILSASTLDLILLDTYSGDVGVLHIGDGIIYKVQNNHHARQLVTPHNAFFMSQGRDPRREILKISFPRLFNLTSFERGTFDAEIDHLNPGEALGAYSDGFHYDLGAHPKSVPEGNLEQLREDAQKDPALAAWIQTAGVLSAQTKPSADHATAAWIFAEVS